MLITYLEFDGWFYEVISINVNIYNLSLDCNECVWIIPGTYE